MRPLANDTADDPTWSQFDASYAGTVWLPPAPAASKMHIKAAGSYYQVRWRERERERRKKENTRGSSFFRFFFLNSHSLPLSFSFPTS